MLGSVPAGEPALQRELFGPVAPVVTFATEEEAIALANDTVHGLAAYLYSGDLVPWPPGGRGTRVGHGRGQPGSHLRPAAPFGGVKESGIGREGGHEGLLEYLEVKYIAADW